MLSKNFVFSAEKYRRLRDKFSARKSFIVRLSFLILRSNFRHISHSKSDCKLLGLDLISDVPALSTGFLTILFIRLSNSSDEFESSFVSTISTEFESGIGLKSTEFESVIGLMKSTEFETVISFNWSAEFESAIIFVGSVLMFLSDRNFPLFLESEV